MTIKNTYEDLTPSEELFIELLIARHRLGECVWTFSNRQLRIARRLEEKGYIGSKGGVTEGNFRAWLTDDAKKVLLAYPYVAPVIRKLKEENNIA